MKEEISFEDKVGLMLINLTVDEIFVLDGSVKKENREKFISVVKSYIDRNFLNNDGMEIIFSNDYSKLKKQHI